MREKQLRTLDRRGDRYLTQPDLEKWQKVEFDSENNEQDCREHQRQISIPWVGK